MLLSVVGNCGGEFSGVVWGAVVPICWSGGGGGLYGRCSRVKALTGRLALARLLPATAPGPTGGGPIVL